MPKCLVVDDSAITRRILVNSLRAAGFAQVIEATDGRQALQLCDTSIDIVVTDWNMPGMNGVDLVRSLRANPAFASLRILLISARNEREDVVEAARAGVDGYMVKPFTPDTLRAKIEEMLQARSGHAGEPAGAEPTATEEAGAAEEAGTAEEAGADSSPEPGAAPATGTDG